MDTDRIKAITFSDTGEMVLGKSLIHLYGYAEQRGDIQNWPQNKTRLDIEYVDTDGIYRARQVDSETVIINLK